MAQYWTTHELAAAQRELEDSITGYREPAAFALGVATRGPSGDILDVSYPHPNLADRGYVAAALAKAAGHTSGTASVQLTKAQVDAFGVTLESAAVHVEGDHPNRDVAHAIARMLDAPAPRGGQRVAVAAFIGALDDDIVDSIDAYLRLHLLSSRLVKPNGVNVNGIFAKLTNVVWTNHGPFEVEGFELRRAELKAEGLQVQVDGLDKFPRMTDYVIPSGVRIADASRVRLGAHLASGTTVMHEGYCNFNAGTLGVSMIEGRISQGVVIGNGSDVGGGASIMGTLSGGGTETISVGENCLIGAEGGIGISLGDDCIVEAGCFITAGTRVTAPDGSVVKGRELSGHDGLLFRRNSQTGVVEALARTEGSSWQGLNKSLHDN